MINAFVNTPVAVAAGASVPFSGSRAKTRSGCYCNGGWLTHSDGSAQYLISRPGIYMVSVGAQVTSAVAAAVATLAITTNGEALAGTTMAETITAAGDVAQLATTALLTVPCGASITVALTNTGDDDITVNAASLVLTRVA
jgi:hypothetical protein